MQGEGFLALEGEGAPAFCGAVQGLPRLLLRGWASALDAETSLTSMPHKRTLFAGRADGADAFSNREIVEVNKGLPRVLLQLGRHGTRRCRVVLLTGWGKTVKTSARTPNGRKCQPLLRWKVCSAKNAKTENAQASSSLELNVPSGSESEGPKQGRLRFGESSSVMYRHETCVSSASVCTPACAEVSLHIILLH